MATALVSARTKTTATKRIAATIIAMITVYEANNMVSDSGQISMGSIV